MRDGQGNKLSPEEQQRVRSIQGDPGKDATTKVSIDPEGKAKTPTIRPKSQAISPRPARASKSEEATEAAETARA